MSYARNSSQDLIYNDYNGRYELATTIYTLTITPMPEDSTVTFTGNGTVSGNSISGVCNTEVTYTISKLGYNTKSGVFILNHNANLDVVLTDEQVFYNMQGAGGGQPTYINIPTNTTTTLFAWLGGGERYYTAHKKPSVYEPLYNNSGVKLSAYTITGIKGDSIMVKKGSNAEVQADRDNANDIIKTVDKMTFYKNGGGGSGGKGEDWANGAGQYIRKGGAGGGYYWLNPESLVITSIKGKDAGENANNNPNLFPNVFSGQGGASGTGNGSTVVNGRTSSLKSGGAPGANSAPNPNSNNADAYYGSGGGGSGGCEDASGGAAGAGNPSYTANTTGTDAYNVHKTPTTSTNYLGQPSLKGQGGNAASDNADGGNGNSGWLYIYRFEREYETISMGNIGGEQDQVSKIIDGQLVTDTNITRIIDGGTASNTATITETIDGDMILYSEPYKDCGGLFDETITETIKLGGI